MLCSIMESTLVIEERVLDMSRMRFLGFGLLGVCGLAIAASVGIAVFGAQNDWAKADVIKATAAFLVAAEVCFWTGGGILGLSIIQKRRAALARFLGRLAFWRRSNAN